MSTKFHVTILACIAAGLSAPAYASCYEPSAPYCASSYGDFDDQYEFDRCRREMQNYQSEVENYLSCVEGEMKRLRYSAETVTSDFNSAVASFNRRAN
ncbi:hypothetical protein [Kaistia sp. UC242_56]|uniref:hypothetical protein n=1 Tax=Kaistia sp. UC242_56 TaxID=3374625 RepID=UPI0037A67780